MTVTSINQITQLCKANIMVCY